MARQNWAYSPIWAMQPRHRVAKTIRLSRIFEAPRGGPYGHLSNQAAADIACAVNHSRLTHLVAAHVSDQNHRRDLVQSVMSKALGRNSSDIVVVGASSGTPWLQVWKTYPAHGGNGQPEITVFDRPCKKPPLGGSLYEIWKITSQQLRKQQR